MKYALIGVGAFVAVAAMGFFCALAGGVSWGTPAAGTLAITTCTIGLMLGCIAPMLVRFFEA